MTFILEYIWLDVNGCSRSKTKIITNRNTEEINISDVPEWNYDGSSTGQAHGSDSEVILKPCVMYPDPFRKGDKNKLVLCETYNPDGTPHYTNERHKAMEIFKQNTELTPMFGIEQEFFITQNGCPVSIPNGDMNLFTKSHGKFYCGVGGDHIIGREYMEETMSNCLYAGVSLTGMNAEVSPSQWEFQVCEIGINAGDHMTILRYIMERTSEKYGWDVNYDAKPIENMDWNGSGCHVNFSTKPMRETNGFKYIIEAIKKLELKHNEHMSKYGDDNKKRMTGKHETSAYDTFTYGVANRGASVRIPRETEKNGCGYFEDRRPSSSMNPYIVTSLIFQTTSLE